MGILSDKWNKNKFSIYDSEEKTSLKLIEKIKNFLGNDVIKEVENKTDLRGNHLGQWQGLNKPTLSEEGMRAVVEKINDNDLPVINEKINIIENDNISKQINAKYPPQPFVGIIEGVDQTQVLQNLINNFTNIVIPKGNYIINGTIKLANISPRTITLLSGTTLLKTELADNVDPLIWICGQGHTVQGEERWGCLIETRKDSPRGVISLGYQDMNDLNPKTVTYCNINNLNIKGKAVNSTGNNNVGLYMANNEINNQPSYFHNISNLIIRFVNTGILLEGYSNANIFNDIQFIYVGTNRYLEGASIKLKAYDNKYPIENTFNNIVQGGMSDGAYVLYFEGKSYMNSFTNIVAEPGGTTGNESIFAKVVGTEHTENIITGLPNTRGGFGFDNTFYMQNTVTLGSYSWTKTFKANDLTVNNKLTSNVLIANNIKNGYIYEDTFKTTALTENNSYTLLNLNIGTLKNLSFMVEVDHLIKNNSAIDVLLKTACYKFGVNVSSSGSITITKLTGNSNGVIIEPIVTGTNIKFGIKIPNNGTSTVNTNVITSYKIIIEDISAITITKILDNTSSVTGTIIS